MSELQRQPQNCWLGYEACKHVAAEDPSFDELQLQAKVTFLMSLCRSLPWEMRDVVQEGVSEYQLSVEAERRRRLVAG